MWDYCEHRQMSPSIHMCIAQLGSGRFQAGSQLHEQGPSQALTPLGYATGTLGGAPSTALRSLQPLAGSSVASKKVVTLRAGAQEGGGGGE